jgi:hypothetical protein
VFLEGEKAVTELTILDRKDFRAIIRLVCYKFSDVWFFFISRWFVKVCMGGYIFRFAVP